MWKYLANVEPPAKKAKQDEGERSNYHKDYDQTKRKWSILPQWLTEFKWLKYDEEKPTMTCKICVLYEQEGSFVKGLLMQFI